MIRTLKQSIVTTISNQNYAKNWTYIEVPNTAFTYNIDRDHLSDDITIDWGDGTIDHKNTHTYNEVDESWPSRIVKIQGVHIMMCIYNDIIRIPKIHRTPFDSEHTIGLLSLEKFPDSFNESQRNLDYICSGLNKTPLISEHFFDNCSDTTSFKYSLRYMNRLTTVPENLFSKCTEVKSFSSTFEGCKALNKIPENLFANCRKVTSFSMTFCGCEQLKTIPEKLFKNNTAVTTFEGTFADSGIEYISDKTFDTTLKAYKSFTASANANNVVHMFKGTPYFEK